MGQTLHFVCMLMGSGIPIRYVTRLERMLRRHVHQEFDLTCVTDVRRKLPACIKQVVTRPWPMPLDRQHATNNKLRLFDPMLLPFQQFFYMDVSVVVHRDLSELLAFANGRPEDLIVVRDWHYDGFNTCVMRLRTGGPLAEVPRAFLSGVRYPQKVPGDQDFVTAFVRDHGLESHVACWPDSYVMSYKFARHQNRMDGRSGYELLDRAPIVKFHGRPKMHDLLNPWFHLSWVYLAARNGLFWTWTLWREWR